jgi:hypothetical protein
MVDQYGYICLSKNKLVKFNNYKLETVNPYCKRIVEQIDNTLYESMSDEYVDIYSNPTIKNKNTLVSKVAYDNQITFMTPVDIIYFDIEINNT